MHLYPATQHVEPAQPCPPHLAHAATGASQPTLVFGTSVVVPTGGGDAAVVITVEVITLIVVVAGAGAGGAGDGGAAAAPGVHWLYHRDCLLQTWPRTQHVEPVQPSPPHLLHAATGDDAQSPTMAVVFWAEAVVVTTGVVGAGAPVGVVGAPVAA